VSPAETALALPPAAALAIRVLSCTTGSGGSGHENGKSDVRQHAA